MGYTLLIAVPAYVASGIVFALLCRSIARLKGYEKVSGYAAMGFFLNILALIYMAGLPDLKARAAFASLYQPSSGQAGFFPAQVSTAQDPAVIAAITAAISMVWDDDALASGAAAQPFTAGQSSPVGFVIRKVRRV
jgi:hypothetical protein